MINKTSIRMVEDRKVETGPSATLEMTRLKLSGYAKESLGVQVHGIPGATEQVGVPTVQIRPSRGLKS